MDTRALHRDLIDLHGRPEKAYSEDGVRQLLTTILSQNVADVQTARAAENLFETYPDYRAMETADQAELADVISDVGLMNQKSRRIQRSLQRIRAETGGEYTLAFLDGMDTEAAQDWLTDIKGVGPKTANVVLSFHFEKPTFAVDTHIERLSTRFGLTEESTTAEGAHEILNRKIPDDLKYSLHVLLIRHGREYCSAQDADCANPVCETYCDCVFC
jgi:endonuclease-3